MISDFQLRTQSLILGVSILLLGCAVHTPSPNDSAYGSVSQNTVNESNDPVFSIFLAGDAGGASLSPREPVLKLLHKQLMESGKNSAVIFLGDNAYPDGLPPKKAEGRNIAKKRLDAQLKTVKDYPGRVIFIPGNHDWKSAGVNGHQWIIRQEKYIESYLNRGNTFLPDSGYPGPVSVELGSRKAGQAPSFNIRLLILDTQWWLHPHSKPIYSGIENEQEQKKQILARTGNLLNEYRNNELLVAGHHPLFSYGRHGGYFSFKAHLLPPIFGSLFVGYRNIWGYPQDIASYKNLKKGLLNHFADHDQLIYASGHDHSLQFIPRQRNGKQQYYLISGAASRTSFVKKQRLPAFTYQGKGFMAIRYFPDRTKQIVIWNQGGKVIYQKLLSSDSDKYQE